MNEKYSEYLKDLPPELQEKAKDIKTNEELLEFLSDNDVELPEEALENVSGGCYVKQKYVAGKLFERECPDCGGDLLYKDNVQSNGYRTRAQCPNSGILYWRLEEYGDDWVVYNGNA